MATEEGLVFKATKTTAWVKTQRKKSCDHCEARDECKTMGNNPEDMEISLPNTVNAKEGDIVVLSMPTTALLKLSFLMYVFPIIIMIIGAVIGQSLSPLMNLNPTVGSVILSVIFFGLTIYAIRVYSNRLASKGKYKPTIARIKRKRSDHEDEKTDDS